MPVAPPILAYEPPRPRRRRLHPILAVVVAHCVASYAVAASAIAFNVISGRRPASPWRDWLPQVLLRWFPLAPINFPTSMADYFIALRKGRVSWQASPIVFLLIHAALFAVAFALLIRRRSSPATV